MFVPQQSPRLSSAQWLRYFEENSSRNLDLEKIDAHVLSCAERERIEASIRKFQVGEASEGRLLKARGQAHAAQVGDTLYPKVIAYLIREENRHSAYLAHFMRLHELEFAKSDWTDGIFRRLRHLGGLDLSIRVLVVAEIIALSYYACLAQATGSAMLARICARMCDEEVEHIRFQMLTVYSIARRSCLRSIALRALQAVLIAAAIIVVAIEHRHVIRCRQRLSTFIRECWRNYRDACALGKGDAVLADGSHLHSPYVVAAGGAI